MEVIIDIQYSCGCGFRTQPFSRPAGKPLQPLEDPSARALHEAIAHVEKTGHTIAVSGKIKPGE